MFKYHPGRDHKAPEKILKTFSGTCKINEVEPLAWLTDVLTKIPEHKANKLYELLPQNWKKQVSAH